MRNNKIYIFGHRGASAYCVENTLQSFKMACNMEAHIETDIRLTKDDKLVTFHDPGFKIDDKYYKIKNLTLKELREINFGDGRTIPKLEELFECFSDQSQLKFSFDIGSKRAGLELIQVAKQCNMVDRIFITDTRIQVLNSLRDNNPDINLVHTIPHRIAKLEDTKIDIPALKELDINILNIKANRYYKNNFEVAINNEFMCFFWGVNTKIRMKRLMRMELNGCKINGIYTDYPDHAVSICNELYEGR
jgi:glycerophosphoryl diester phosphodiesterase